MESKSFGNGLKNVLNLVYYQGVHDCCYLTDEPTMETEEAKQAIIDLVKELVPESKDFINLDDYSYREAHGWNELRQSILDKLK